MKWKQLIPLMLVLMFLPVVTAEMCENEQVITNGCRLLTPNLDNGCTPKNYTIWNVTGQQEENGSLALLSSNIYYVDINLSRGDYIVEICNATISREITVVPEDDTMFFGMIALLPMLLGLFFLLGSFFLGEDHQVLKIFLFLLSIVPFFSSLHLAALSVAQYYQFPELINAIGTTIYWVGLVVVLLVIYFSIYLVSAVMNTLKQKKEERLRY